MDDNNFKIIVELMIAQTTLILGLMGFMWKSLSNRIDRLEIRLDMVEKSLGNRIDKLDEKITDIDRRLCRVEGILEAKECCLLRGEHRHPKAE